MATSMTVTILSAYGLMQKTIGELEGIDKDTQFILEVAAIVHDIACPICREKYGNTNGKHQEKDWHRTYFVCKRSPA